MVGVVLASAKLPKPPAPRAANSLLGWSDELAALGARGIEVLRRLGEDTVRIPPARACIQPHLDFAFGVFRNKASSVGLVGQKRAVHFPA